ncbi:hypothetical protein [Neobacillus sp. LXY-4]|uniref:hypothetical protein n=1 Tax=Neobacillus sp. LXY-4 TaxID=3379826 RepID=UPI003EE3C2EA
MNIQQYYRSAANIALNESIASFVPVILILGGGIYFSVDLPLFLVILPFIVFSFYCYQIYLIQHRRSLEAMTKKPSVDLGLVRTEHLLITFMPAPSLRMLLFEPNGNLIGEVRDERFWWWRWFLPYFIDKRFPKTYGLYSPQNKLKAYYRINARTKEVKIYDSDQNEMGVFNKKAVLKNIFEFDHSVDWSGRCETPAGEGVTGDPAGAMAPRRLADSPAESEHLEQKSTAKFYRNNKKIDPTSQQKRMGVIHSLLNNQDIFVEGSSVYQAKKFRNQQGHVIGKLIKGWMPLEWGHQFRDANTPILIFDEKLNETEKILMIGVLVDFYHYTSH